MPDVVLWQAMHADCPLDGCGACTTVDIDWTDEEYEELRAAAEAQGVDISVYIHRVILIGMRSEGYV